MLLGERIKEIRLSKQMKQSDLAHKASISRVAVGNYERCERQPTAEILKRIAEALEVSPSELLGWNEYEKQAKEYDEFIKYIKSLGYNVSEISEPCLIPANLVPEDFKSEHSVCGESYSIKLSRKDVSVIFSEEEFQKLQGQNKDFMDAAILLQQEKQKSSDNK